MVVPALSDPVYGVFHVSDPIPEGLETAYRVQTMRGS